MVHALVAAKSGRTMSQIWLSPSQNLNPMLHYGQGPHSLVPMLDLTNFPL